MPDSPEKVQGTIPDLERHIWIAAAVDAFITDRRAQGFAPGTVAFYRKKLKYFLRFCASSGLEKVTDLTPDDLRAFLLELEEGGHNPGGIHAAYRTVRALLYWWEDEYEPEDWRNPIRKVKAPKIKTEPLAPASIEDIRLIIGTCKADYGGKRDRAMILIMLDTGLRAGELVDLDIGDMDWMTGELTIRNGKGGKGRAVFLGTSARRAIRAYLKAREDYTERALFVTHAGRRLTYWGLRGMFIRRAKQADVACPERHGFRRYFALAMLRGGVDIFSLQKLMGHADIQVLRRYLAQVNDDLRAAHQRGNPVDGLGL